MNTKILPSEIHGLGLFAVTLIKKGEKILQPDKMDLTQDVDKWIKYNSSGQKQSFAYLCGYCLVNHSTDANTERNDGFDIIASRDILKGEEVTENYDLLSDEDNPFKNSLEEEIFYYNRSK